MAEQRRPGTPAPSRTVPRKVFVHLSNGNEAWCGASGDHITLIDDEESAAPNQQVCGSCKMNKTTGGVKASSKRGVKTSEVAVDQRQAGRTIRGNPAPTPVSTPVTKTFKQQQAEELAAAAAKRKTSRNGAVQPLSPPAPAAAKRSNGRPAPASPPPARSGVVRKPSQVIETRVTGKRNCTTVAEALIRQGKTNQEVWDVISVEFSLDNSKRGYPSWYRSRLRRNNEDV